MAGVKITSVFSGFKCLVSSETTSSKIISIPSEIKADVILVRGFIVTHHFFSGCIEITRQSAHSDAADAYKVEVLIC
jgi:hypothetical protein